MAAQNTALPVHKVAGRRSLGPGVQPGGVVPAGDKADLHAVRLMGHGHPPLGRQGPDLYFFIPPQREHGPAQDALGQTSQHVGLVVGGLALAQKNAALGPLGHPGVVAGGHIAAPQLLGLLQQSGELHQGIAPGAGQGGAARQILLHKGLADEVLQFPADVLFFKGQPQPVGHGGRVLAASQADVQPEAVDLIALPQKQSRYGGVHPAGESQYQMRLLHRSTSLLLLVRAFGAPRFPRGPGVSPAPDRSSAPPCPLG